MTNRFLISVAAAALIAGTGLANAQGTGTSREAPSAAPAAQPSSPSADRAAPSAATPMNRDSATDSKGADTGMKKSTQSEEKTPKAGTAQRAQDDMKPGMKGEKPAQEKSAQDSNMKGEKSKSSENDNAKDNAKGGGKDMKADSKGTDSKTTTGQAGAGAKLSGEQRTKITTVIKEQHVAPVTNVNFSISVGTRVPRGGVTFHPLPAQIVTIYPEWRGYEFILVRDQIVVIDPQTLEIVAVIDA